MHFSANAPSCDRTSSVCPSVCPFATLVDFPAFSWVLEKEMADWPSCPASGVCLAYVRVSVRRRAGVWFQNEDS